MVRRSRRNPLLAALCLVVILAAGARAFEDADFMYLADGDRCFVDRFVVMVKTGTPSLDMESFNNGLASPGIASLDNLCQINGITGIDRWYPYEVIHEKTREFVDRLYIFFVEDDGNVVDAAASFAGDPHVEASELYRIPRPVRIPNDPSRPSQWFLNRIDAYQAWDLIWGSETEGAIIGIVDTGVYWTHPDINPNMWEGIGEDMSNYDGNPTEPYPIHGTHVAGCASEATDNGIGGAGIGWSARIMAIKGADNGGNLLYVYQGITWAGDHGADIINCSWGSVGYSSYEQSIINEVYNNHDVLVVAAAGNDDYWTPPYTHYPSAYNHVLAVAATNASDDKASFSNYGSWVDVCAPGESIYSTWGSNSYEYLSGTSMSSPIVAGVAALVRAADPTLSADEAADMIMDGAEPINDYYYNQGWMGSGRVNAFNAVEPLMNIIEPPNLLSPGEDQFLTEHYPTFTWNEADNAVSYHLQVDDVSSFTSPIINSSSIAETTYTSPAYLDDGLWYWRVRSNNGSEWSDWSPEMSFGIDTQAPGSPIDLDAVPDGWSNDPTFVINWTNPADLSGVNIALYKMNQPPVHNFDFDGLMEDVPPGQYEFSSSGIQTIYVWLMDNAENTDYTTNVSDEMMYDGTPPSGCVAASPPVSSELDFEVSWTAGEDEHSGLSGIYDVQYRDGEGGEWILWLDGVSGTSEVFAGEDGHTYYFEARNYDNAGNAEPFTDEAETQTLVDTQYIPGCEYAAGDVNGNGIPLELGDVVAMTGIYRGTETPAFTCDCPPHGDDFAATADPNGNCVPFELNDVVVEVGAYRGDDAASGCPDCPGSRRMAPQDRIGHGY
jgi:subtilisin family serine protease